MADERFGGSNGVLFTNVRIIDGRAKIPTPARSSSRGIGSVKSLEARPA